jgi:hypothetical protein
VDAAIRLAAQRVVVYGFVTDESASEITAPHLFLGFRGALTLFESSANVSACCAMVSAIARLWTNCPSLRHSINCACFKILKWCEIVAGVTPRSLARSPEVMSSFAVIATNIHNRVSSASAFDMFSICLVFIIVPSMRLPSALPMSSGRSVLNTRPDFLIQNPLQKRHVPQLAYVGAKADPEILPCGVNDKHVRGCGMCNSCTILGAV